MSNKSETKAAEAAPVRSVARATLARQISAREAARQKVQDREAAARRLTVIGETAQAIASQLAAQKILDAERLAQFALDGTGKAPTLTDETRAQLYARLAEAEAKAEAAVPALAIVHSEIASAHTALNQASAAVQIVDVISEELTFLDNEIRALTEKLIPLQARLVGLRSWTFGAGAGKDDAQRAPYDRLTNAVSAVMEARLVSLQTPTRGTEDAVWRPLADALLTNPDAAVSTYAEEA